MKSVKKKKNRNREGTEEGENQFMYVFFQKLIAILREKKRFILNKSVLEL